MNGLPDAVQERLRIEEIQKKSPSPAGLYFLLSLGFDERVRRFPYDRFGGYELMDLLLIIFAKAA